MTASFRPWLAAALASCCALGCASATAQVPAAPAAPVSAPEPKLATDAKLTLKWSTASEVDNYGFFVLRGDKEDGPFQQRNSKAIPGGGNSDTPRQYVWEDHDVVAGKTYYYYLESISVQGVREKFSPIISKVCCNAPSPAPAAAPAPAVSPKP
jgi:hypothetical protein